MKHVSKTVVIWSKIVATVVLLLVITDTKCSSVTVSHLIANEVQKKQFQLQWTLTLTPNEVQKSSVNKLQLTANLISSQPERKTNML